MYLQMPTFYTLQLERHHVLKVAAQPIDNCSQLQHTEGYYQQWSPRKGCSYRDIKGPGTINHIVLNLKNCESVYDVLHTVLLNGMRRLDQ